MARVLVIYATREGQTGKIARHLAEQLAGHGHACEVVDADHATAPIDVDRFDMAVVGGPIHAGGYPRSILQFVKEHRQFLERTSSAFFSVGLAVASRTSDGRAQTMKLVDEFIERTGWRPARIELIAGALPYSKYNFLVKFVMRRISRHEGGATDTSRDYEYTDWPAVDRFAKEIAPAAVVASSR